MVIDWVDRVKTWKKPTIWSKELLFKWDNTRIFVISGPKCLSWCSSSFLPLFQSVFMLLLEYFSSNISCPFVMGHSDSCFCCFTEDPQILISPKLFFLLLTLTSRLFTQNKLNAHKSQKNQTLVTLCVLQTSLSPSLLLTISHWSTLLLKMLTQQANRECSVSDSYRYIRPLSHKGIDKYVNYILLKFSITFFEAHLCTLLHLSSTVFFLIIKSNYNFHLFCILIMV